MKQVKFPNAYPENLKPNPPHSHFHFSQIQTQTMPPKPPSRRAARRSSTQSSPPLKLAAPEIVIESPPNDAVLAAPAIIIEPPPSPPPPNDVVSGTADSLGNPNSNPGGKTKRVVKRTVRVIRKIVKKVRVVKPAPNPNPNPSPSSSPRVAESDVSGVPLSMEEVDKLEERLALCEKSNGNERDLEVRGTDEGVNAVSTDGGSMGIDKLEQRGDLCEESDGNERDLGVRDNVASNDEDSVQERGDICEGRNGNEGDLGVRDRDEGGLVELDGNVGGGECGKVEGKGVLGEALDGAEEVEVKEGDDDNVAKIEDGAGEGTYYSGEMEALERRRRRKTEIFVGGLDNEAKEEDIRKVFEEVGEVVGVRLMMNGSTGKNKGFAFLRYASAVDAKKALEKFSSVKVCGKQCGAMPIEGNDTIHLGGIDKNWKEENIAKLLQEIGIEGIDTIVVMKDPENKERNRGYAFVEFETCRDAQFAFKKLQNIDVFGKSSKMKVAWAGPLNEPNEAEMRKVKTVYAEYIPLTWDEGEVKENFEKFGEIDNVILARNLRNAKRKDYAFISYKTREAAIACIGSFKHQPQNDEGTKMNVKVSLARPVSSNKQPKLVPKPISKEIPVVRPNLKQGSVLVRQFGLMNNAANVRLLDPRNSAINLTARHIDPRNSASHVTVRQIDPRNSADHVTVRQMDPRHTHVSRIPHYDIHRPELRYPVHRDERSSPTSERIQLMREQASWMPPHAGPLNVGHPATFSGRKRPISSLDTDPAYSDMSRYPNYRLQTSLLERYGAHPPQSSTFASSAYHRGQANYPFDLPYSGAQNYLGSEPRDRAHGSGSLYRRY